MQIDTSTMRHRVKGVAKTTTETFWSWDVFNANGARKGGGYNNTGRQVTQANQIDMWDIKTSLFKKISGDGGIVNSPMRKIAESSTFPAFNVTEHTIFTTGDSLRGNGVVAALCPSYTLSTPQTAINSAITSAFAKVTANEANALLWIGEMNESISMFLGMGQALLKLLRMTERQRKAYLKGLLTVSEAQSLTLQIQYGLLPLQEQMQQWQDGLTKMKKPGRTTVRGYNTYADSKSYRKDFGDSNFEWRVDVEETISSNIRAGVLFDIDPPEFPLMAVFEPRGIVEMAYALARLSFVIDWFVNVGSTLAAWSPTVGTDILSAWVTVEEAITVTGVNKWLPKLNSNERSQSYSGNAVATRYYFVKTRYPVGLADRPILPTFDVDLNLSKIASLVLLFARAK